MVEHVVAEAVRASNFFGLSGDLAKRYGQGIRGPLPLGLDALTEPDVAERDRKMDAVVAMFEGSLARTTFPGSSSADS